jgi:hypothetical protein
VRGISFVNLTIGITYTAPGGAPPMHTHLGEEAHVLTDRQKIRYALGDEVFDLEGPTSSTSRRWFRTRSRIWTTK